MYKKKEGSMLRSILNYFTKPYAKQLKELAAGAVDREKERQYKSLLAGLKSLAEYGYFKQEAYRPSLPEDTILRLEALGFKVIANQSSLSISWE